MKIEDRRIKINNIWFDVVVIIPETINLSQNLWKKVYNHLEEPGYIKISQTFKIRMNKNGNEAWKDILLALGYKSTTFDWAVPQDYFNKYSETFKMPSDMVWFYDKGDHFGQPMFLEEIIERFCSLVKRHVLEVGYEPVQVSN